MRQIEKEEQAIVEKAITEVAHGKGYSYNRLIHLSDW